MPKDDTCDSKRKVQTTLVNVNEIESDTCQRKYNMKMKLIKVKTRKSDSHKHESDTCESEGAQK